MSVYRIIVLRSQDNFTTVNWLIESKGKIEHVIFQEKIEATYVNKWVGIDDDVKRASVFRSKKSADNFIQMLKREKSVIWIENVLGAVEFPEQNNTEVGFLLSD